MSQRKTPSNKNASACGFKTSMTWSVSNAPSSSCLSCRIPNLPPTWNSKRNKARLVKKHFNLARPLLHTCLIRTSGVDENSYACLISTLTAILRHYTSITTVRKLHVLRVSHVCLHWRQRSSGYIWKISTSTVGSVQPNSSRRWPEPWSRSRATRDANCIHTVHIGTAWSTNAVAGELTPRIGTTLKTTTRLCILSNLYHTNLGAMLHRSTPHLTLLTPYHPCVTATLPQLAVCLCNRSFRGDPPGPAGSLSWLNDIK